MLKRFFDIIVSFFGLIIVSPILGVIAILIKISSPGPVFYRGTRTGRAGKSFKIFKFRTMVKNAEVLGGPSTASDDPRLTKIGKFLKKYQLDELPQLINVLIRNYRRRPEGGFSCSKDSLFKLGKLDFTLS